MGHNMLAYWISLSSSQDQGMEVRSEQVQQSNPYTKLTCCRLIFRKAKPALLPQPVKTNMMKQFSLMGHILEEIPGHTMQCFPVQKAGFIASNSGQRSVALLRSTRPALPLGSCLREEEGTQGGSGSVLTPCHTASRKQQPELFSPSSLTHSLLEACLCFSQSYYHTCVQGGRLVYPQALQVVVFPTFTKDFGHT